MKDDSVFPRPPGFDCIGRAIVPGGLTKRELFAAMAMQSIIGETDTRDLTDSSVLYRDAVAADAVIFADALIVALEKEKP